MKPEVAMDLWHFSAEVFPLKRKAYKQRADFKPKGFWVSVGDSWKEWCEAESFRIQHLAVRRRVALSHRADILHLESAQDIDGFTDEFLRDGRYGFIDWPAVAERWQGIVIAPYCWARRLTDRTTWYYGWDCASGCIWDLDAIQTLMALPGIDCSSQAEDDMEQRRRFA